MESKNNTEAAPALVIKRVFNAPRELVFKMWTEAEHLAKWWGPKGFNVEVSKLNVEPGGEFLYCMKGDGFEMWGKFAYLEVATPEKLVFINSFSDKDGNITRAPFSATWPLEVMNILTLTEENGVTTLELKGGPHNASDEERQTFEAGIPSMNQGFGGTFDQLDEYLISIKQ